MNTVKVIKISFNMWNHLVKPCIIGFSNSRNIKVLSSIYTQRRYFGNFSHRMLDGVNYNTLNNNNSPTITFFTGNRYKSKKTQKQEKDEDDDIVEFDTDDTLKKDSKILKFSSTSLRTDTMIKAALGVSRNKIEQLFYESKIRVNGKKILKKSNTIHVGDEIDVIKMVSPKNADHLYVSRIEIMNLKADEESIEVTARRFKNLLIENYEKAPYKATDVDEDIN